MILSRACEYGVQALIHLNAYPEGTYVPVRAIAQAQRISPTFLSKIVRQLVTSRLLTSVKGPGGGVRLSRSAGHIKLLDVVRAIDGLEIFDRCVIGEPRCRDPRTCPVHTIWRPIHESIHQVFSTHSLDDLSKAYAKVEFRDITSGVAPRAKRHKGV